MLNAYEFEGGCFVLKLLPFKSFSLLFVQAMNLTIKINKRKNFDFLKYKFIFSVEGNDVASNLKWILNSNSLCFMQKPTIETWAMEGLLEAGVHYVELKDDLSNLESQYLYYLNNPKKAKSIIRNANKFINQIKNESLQLEIAIGVAKKYFRLSGQA
jgi:hypothetical protein